MWNNLLDNAKAVAEKAKAAAEQLEGTLNESVGAADGEANLLPSASTSNIARNGSIPGIKRFMKPSLTPLNPSIATDDDESFEVDDAFYDDDDFDVDMHDNLEVVEDTKLNIGEDVRGERNQKKEKEEMKKMECDTKPLEEKEKDNVIMNRMQLKVGIVEAESIKSSIIESEKVSKSDLELEENVWKNDELKVADVGGQKVEEGEIPIIPSTNEDKHIVSGNNDPLDHSNIDFNLAVDDSEEEDAFVGAERRVGIETSNDKVDGLSSTVDLNALTNDTGETNTFDNPSSCSSPKEIDTAFQYKVNLSKEPRKLIGVHVGLEEHASNKTNVGLEKKTVTLDPLKDGQQNDILNGNTDYMHEEEEGEKAQEDKDITLALLCNPSNVESQQIAKQGVVECSSFQKNEIVVIDDANTDALPSTKIISVGIEDKQGKTEENSLMHDLAVDTISSGAVITKKYETAPNYEQTLKLQGKHDHLMSDMKAQFTALKAQLSDREAQLISKSQQITTMAETYEKEKTTLKGKIRETKDEAKKRITKAKERVEEMQIRLDEANARAESVGSSQDQQDDIIQALRSEGEVLARKQGDMEQRLRETRGEIRNLKDELEDRVEENTKANAMIAELKEQLKNIKEELSAARKNENRADKLDSDLLAVREEKEKNASSILVLEAQLKEVKSRNMEIQKEMETALKENTSENEFNCLQHIKEKDEIMQDFELKLKNSERESIVREDSLRHEVSELRKRWQDTVRRADALSIDLQQSSAPLMRQLESTERQNRTRAAASAELETKLRSELENYVVRNEELSKENNSLSMESRRLMRSSKDKEDELVVTKCKLEEVSQSERSLCKKYEDVNTELQKISEAHSEVTKKMKGDESNNRNKMMKALRDNETRYNDQLESLEVELRQEREKRITLEEKVQSLLMSTEVVVPTSSDSIISSKYREKEQRLSAKTNPVDILQNTLFDLGEDNSDDDGTTVEESSDNSPSPGGNFALMEQITNALKSSKVERDAFRKQLEESEGIREKLLSDLAENADASEQLPTLLAELSELRKQVKVKNLEIEGLRDDMLEIRQMYGSQLHALLEENAKPNPVNTSLVTTPAKENQNVMPKVDEANAAIDALATNFGIM